MKITWFWLAIIIGAVQIGGLNLNMILQWMYSVTTQTVGTAIDATDDFSPKAEPPTVDRL